MSGSDRLHAFDAAIAARVARRRATWQGHTSPAYANMIGPFGGVTAAQALNAVLQHPQRLGEPIAFTVNFAAALADGAFLVHAGRLAPTARPSTGSSRCCQGERTVLTATAVTALRRETWGATRNADAASAAPSGCAAAGAGRPGRMDQPLRHAVHRRRPAAGLGRRRMAAAARSCGCATTRRGRWTSRRSLRWPMCSFRASGAVAPP